MGKESVYIRDPLLKRARRARPDVESTSKLVQLGLEALIDSKRASRDRDPPPGLDAAAVEQMGAIRDRLRAEAEAEFARGYETGVSVLGEVRWDVAERLGSARNSEAMYQVLDDDRYDAMMDGLRESSVRSAGFEQAIRDLVGDTWDEVTSSRSLRRDTKEVGLEDR